MSEPIIREDEGSDAPVALLWDTAWRPTEYYLDWPVAGIGLQSTDPLGTAILLCLFTDRRRPDSITGISERRGWHGDTYDLETANGERPMGSLLWTLQRERLTPEVARIAEHYAADALQTLVDQGLVHHFDVASEIDQKANQLSLHVRAFEASNQEIFARFFPLE